MKYWELVAGKLTAAGVSWGYCSAVTRDGCRWIVDAHKNDGKRYIVQADELLTAFLELGRRCCSVFAIRSVGFSSTMVAIRVKGGLNRPRLGRDVFAPGSGSDPV